MTRTTVSLHHARRVTALPVALLLGTLWSPAVAGQATTLTSQDRTEIQDLVGRYARALAGCAAEEYADLFAAETGYFASNIRGEVVGRDRLIALVRSERHCTVSPTTPTPPNTTFPNNTAPNNTAPNNTAANNTARPATGPVVVIEPAATGATGRADLGSVGYYDDEYVRTANGWRFKFRNVVTPAEQKAGLTTRDAIAIRRLAGTDLGLFADVYVTGADGIARFRTSGVALGLLPDGVTGRASVKDAGGRYEDVYVRTPAGWRFKSRVFVDDAVAAASGAVRQP
jgi:hypothetical protein